MLATVVPGQGRHASSLRLSDQFGAALPRGAALALIISVRQFGCAGSSSDGPRQRRSRTMLLDPDVRALAGNIGRNHPTSSGSEQSPHVHTAAARKYAITRTAERAS